MIVGASSRENAIFGKKIDLKYFAWLFILGTLSAQGQSFGANKSYAAHFASMSYSPERIYYVGSHTPKLGLNLTVKRPEVPNIDPALISVFYGTPYYIYNGKMNLHYSHPGGYQYRMPAPEAREYGPRSRGTWTSWLKKEKID